MCCVGQIYFCMGPRFSSGSTFIFKTRLIFYILTNSLDNFFASLFITNLDQTLNTSHKFWDQSPSPHYQCCLEVSETVFWHKLPCYYSANNLKHWVGGRDLIYFCKMEHCRISRDFSRNWVGLNNLCEIVSQKIWGS